MEDSLTGDNVGREIEQLKHEIQALEVKKNKLLDLRLEEIIEKDDYELKYSEISATIRKYNARLDELTESDLSRKSVQKRIAEFRKVLQEHNTMTKFDRAVFESVVEAVIIGGYNERGEKDPTQISFVYKMGYKDKLDIKAYRSPRKVRRRRETDIHSAKERDIFCPRLST